MSFYKDTTQTDLTLTYEGNLRLVSNQFTTIVDNLEEALDSVFNPDTGMLAGLNCLLLGEDINLIVSTTCSSLFTTIYFLRLTLAMVAFGLLFSVCCITCSGVRAFKNNERRSILPNEETKLDYGGQESMAHDSTVAAFNAKR